jgi:hypothetical protein
MRGGDGRQGTWQGSNGGGGWMHAAKLWQGVERKLAGEVAGADVQESTELVSESVIQG